MTDYLATKEYFAGSYWGQWYWGGIGIRYGEVFRVTLRMNRTVAGTAGMNKQVSESCVLNQAVESDAALNVTVPLTAIMNRVVSDRYDELEKL